MTKVAFLRVWQGTVRLVRRFDAALKRVTVRVYRAAYGFRPLRFAQPLTRKIGKFAVGHYRLHAGFLALLIVASALMPVLGAYVRDQRYVLAAQSQALLGTPNANLTKKLTFDSEKQVFQFNRDGQTVAAPVESTGNEQADVAAMLSRQMQLKQQVGGGGVDDEQLFSVDVPKDLSKGITYYENNVGVSFKLVPDFKVAAGEMRDGQLVYPLDNGSGGTLVYNLAAGGLKEDVVLTKSPGADRLEMRYKLVLSSGSEAKVIPETGQIGIYTADPALMGDISTGTLEDQKAIEEARKNADKNYLAITIPTPSITTLDEQLNAVHNGGNAYEGKLSSRYTLSSDGTSLVVVTEGFDALAKDNYPLSIDPTILVDSTSDFALGNDEDGNLTVASGSVSRSTVSGGAAGAWAETSAFTPVRYGHGSVAYNGYMYVIGGTNSSNGPMTSVLVSTINANGTTSAWSATTPLPENRAIAAVTAYSGYVYVLGGVDSSLVNKSDVFYAPIYANGSLGSWATTTNITTARQGLAAIAYQGYLYNLGGWDGTSAYSDLFQYAKITASGAIGAWTSSTSLPTARTGLAVAVQNNKLYITGGKNSTTYNTVYSVTLQDGVPAGSWTQLASFAGARAGHTAVLHRGYLYVTGGWTGTGSTMLKDVVYAPVYADGTLGSWYNSGDFAATTRQGHSTVAYNGYLYVTGGSDGSSSYGTNLYAPVQPAGYTTGYASTTAFTTARIGTASVVYNGYLYITGGRNNNGSTSYSDVRFAPLNADGTLGAWTNTTAFSGAGPARYAHAAIAYDGYLYIIGGASGSTTSPSRYSTILYAPINTDGSIGSWAVTSQGISGGSRLAHVAMAYNGRLYIAGGDLSSGATTAVWAFVIAANGNLTTASVAQPSMNFARAAAAAVVVGNRWYVMGGYSGSTRYSSVEYATIQSDGSLSSWTGTVQLPAIRIGAAAVAYNGFIYVTGGALTTTGAATTTVYYAPVNADGTITSWSTNTEPTGGRIGHAAVAHAGYLYRIGGGTTNTSGSVNAVDVARINNGGSGVLSTWQDGGQGLSQRYGHASVLYNNYVYLIGGTDSVNSYNTVQYAPINANGTIGTWTNTTSFNTARSGHSSVVYNGYLYVIGGFNGAESYNTVQYAPINANGTIGTWTNTTSFNTARYAHTSVVYNGYMYVLGGTNDNDVYNTVQYAPINANGTIGTWTNTASFSVPRSSHSSHAYNGYLYVIGGFNGAVSTNTVQYAPINANGTIGTWTNTTSFNTARYAHDSVIYNGYMYVLGGMDLSTANSLAGTQRALLNQNGSLGRWESSASLDGSGLGRAYHTSFAYSGRLYVLGGFGVSGVIGLSSYSSIETILRKAVYSRQLSLGGAAIARVSGLSYTGNLPGGNSSLYYRTADSSGVYGTWLSVRDIVPSVALSCSTPRISAIQVRAVLDDSTTGVFADGVDKASLDSITVQYDQMRAPTELRMRMGKWFKDGALQSHETCG